MPFIIFTFDNLAFNLAITVPMVLVSTISVTTMSLAPKDDNMSCYMQPETAANEWIFSWMCQEFVMILGAYIYRRITIERFVDLKKVEKQQDQL